MDAGLAGLGCCLDVDNLGLTGSGCSSLTNCQILHCGRLVFHRRQYGKLPSFCPSPLLGVLEGGPVQPVHYALMLCVSVVVLVAIKDKVCSPSLLWIQSC